MASTTPSHLNKSARPGDRSRHRTGSHTLRTSIAAGGHNVAPNDALEENVLQWSVVKSVQVHQDRFLVYLLDQEIRPVTDGPKDFDLGAYQAKILERFANPAVAYRTAQVANDVSLELQQRIYPSNNRHLARGTLPQGLVLVVGAWLECLATPTLASQFVDPISERISPEDEWLETMPAESKSAGIIREEPRFKNLGVPDIGEHQEHRHQKTGIRTQLQQTMAEHSWV